MVNKHHSSSIRARILLLLMLISSTQPANIYRPFQTLTEPYDIIYGIAISDDNAVLAIGSFDNILNIYKEVNGQFTFYDSVDCSSSILSIDVTPSG